MQLIKNLTIYTMFLVLTLSTAVQAEQSDKETEAKDMTEEMATGKELQTSESKETDIDDKEARIQAKEVLRQMQKKLSTQ